MIYIIIAILAAIADQASKMLVKSKLNIGESHTIINKVFNFSRSENTGIAFGFFDNGGTILKILTLLLIIVVIYMLFTTKNKIGKTGFAIILGGALGNFYDRMFHNGVTDFIDIPPLSFIFPNFNLADFFIVTGTIIVAVYLLFFETKKSKVDVQSDQNNNEIIENKDIADGEK